jgi:hypothetical protein
LKLPLGSLGALGSKNSGETVHISGEYGKGNILLRCRNPKQEIHCSNGQNLRVEEFKSEPVRASWRLENLLV